MDEKSRSQGLGGVVHSYDDDTVQYAHDTQRLREAGKGGGGHSDSSFNV